MPTINSIISGLSPYLNKVVNTVTQSGSASLPKPDSSTAERDVFEQGQWWKNQANRGNISPAGVSVQCNCNNCPSCAVRAYTTQTRIHNPASAETVSEENKPVTEEENGDGGDDSNDLLIALIVIITSIVLVLIVVLVIFVLIRKKRPDGESEVEEREMSPDVGDFETPIGVGEQDNVTVQQNFSTC